MANFLKIDGVNGESTNAQYKDWIDVESFAFVERQLASSYGTGGGPSRRVDMEDFTIQMKSNVASPEFFEACASGKHFQNAELSCTDESGERLKFKFSDLVISSFSIATDANVGTLPTVRVSLNFGKLMMIYVRRQQDGSVGGQTIGGWDVAASKKYG